MNLVLVTSCFYFLLGIILVVFGIVIFKANFRERINRITGLLMFFAGTGPTLAALGLLIQTSTSKIPIETFGKFFLIWDFFFPQLVLFALVYPKETPWVKRHPYTLYLIFLPHVIHLLFLLFASSLDRGFHWLALQNWDARFGILGSFVGLGVSLFLGLFNFILKFHTNFFAFVNVLYVGFALAWMALGYRKLESGTFRRQVQTVLWGILIGVSFYSIAFLFPKLYLFSLPRIAQFFLTTLGLLIGTLTIGWAILKYQFLDVRFIVRRSFVFSLAFMALIGIYLKLYGAIRHWMGVYWGIDNRFLDVVFIFFALLLFPPFLQWIEKWTELLFKKHQLDYRYRLQRLSHEILTTLDPVVLYEKIIHTLKDTLGIRTVEILQSREDGVLIRMIEGKTNPKPGFSRDEEWIQWLEKEKEPIGINSLSSKLQKVSSIESLHKMKAFLLIPLLSHDRLVGVLILGEKINRSAFSLEEITWLTMLANQIAIGIENAQLYKASLEKQRIEEDIRLAQEIQQNLLPKVPPQGIHFELACCNFPSKEVSGDYYDFLSLNERELGIVIGDISGKGIPAAILMSNLQAIFRLSALHARSPSVAMKIMNNQLVHATTLEKFATLFYGILNQKTLVFQYSNAGHHFPILRRANGRIEYLKTGGLLLGFLKDVTYRSAKIRLFPGDVIVFYTDGVTETQNPEREEFGEKRLLEILSSCASQSAEGILNSILDEVTQFARGETFLDDLTLVVLKIK